MQMLAVLLVAVAGLAEIVGLARLRGALLRAGVAVFVISLVLPAAGSFVHDAFAIVPALPVMPVPSGRLVLAIVGHVVLAVVLIRRRFADRDRDQQEIDRARTRERPRLPPPDMDGES